MQTLTGVIQDYAWGSLDGIPATLGTPQTGAPQAEYWLGAHPKAPSTLPDGTPLDAHLAERPALIGAATVSRFGPRLPFLLKVLSADRALSLQAHPSRAQAIEGYARENRDGVALDALDRNYRDDWPKPEAVIALTEFHGLCGFRDPAQTRALFAQLGLSATDDLMLPLAEPDGIARVFLSFLALEDLYADVVAEVVDAARAALRTAEPGTDFHLFCTTAVELAEDYPGDPSLLAALMLNRILLQPGEAFFMPAGNLHAYLRGTGIEVMSNSDNVLRGGLTPKHIDVDELAQVLDFTPGFPGLIEPVEVAPGVLHYPTEALEFAVFQLTEPDESPVPAQPSARIVLVTDGSFTLTVGGEELTLAKGQAAFLEAGEDATVTGAGQAFLAAGGIPVASLH
ncbi:mannose-6-phosphate isomerase, class I [Granulicoccus sp. GXG6511]|uniref:mannose-6-phosphate isomerase, class I n=1 Tax=Granulicoccus sp. GXG6511 TaxID=3381351 RepID=UPI003D7CB15E